MNIDDLTVKEIREIAALAAGFCGDAKQNVPTTHSAHGPQAGDKVIVRSRDAGVQYGTLVSYEGSTVHLTDARQMWSWTAAKGGTLLDCAQHGVSKGKFSSPCNAVTVIGACAIISVHEDAIKSLEAQKWTS